LKYQKNKRERSVWLSQARMNRINTTCEYTPTSNHLLRAACTTTKLYTHHKYSTKAICKCEPYRHILSAKLRNPETCN